MNHCNTFLYHYALLNIMYLKYSYDIDASGKVPTNFLYSKEFRKDDIMVEIYKKCCDTESCLHCFFYNRIVKECKFMNTIFDIKCIESIVKMI